MNRGVRTPVGLLRGGQSSCRSALSGFADGEVSGARLRYNQAFAETLLQPKGSGISSDLSSFDFVFL